MIPAYNEVSEFDVSNLFRSSHALSGLPGKGGKLRGRLRGRSSTGINDASLDSGTFGGGGKLTFSDPNDASLNSGTGIVMPPLWSPPYGASPNWSPVERFGEGEGTRG